MNRIYDRKLIGWLMLAVLAVVILPWYRVDHLFSGWSMGSHAPIMFLLTEKVWFFPTIVSMVALGLFVLLPKKDWSIKQEGGALLLLVGLAFVCLLAQAFTIGMNGWRWTWLVNFFGETPWRQSGVGLGAMVLAIALLGLLAQALARLGLFNHDPFLSTCVVLVVSLVMAFTFYPVGNTLISAFLDSQNAQSTFSLGIFWERFATDKNWRLSCLVSERGCGVVWNTLMVATTSASLATMLGLSFAFVATRTNFPFKKMLRGLTILPIITPPFVIGLGLILIFGRSGLVNQMLEWLFAWNPGRWIYGFQGIVLAQVFAFTPIAFLVLIGVVEGISPSMEEAAQTLRANRWQIFRTISLPLMLPGIANAFLVVFVESISDFGNPIVLGGNFNVLSTEIFFSVVGSQLDQGRAATLAIILLLLGLSAFALQRSVLGKKVFTSLTGKGDSGQYSPLPQGIKWTAGAIVTFWGTMTLFVYGMALMGGFVEIWGRDHSLTLRHYAKTFSATMGEHGVLWTGTAWQSLWSTLQIALLAAPLAAAIGMVTAYVLSRYRFYGRSAFEFSTMLSYAVPGTVIGVSYILAFNTPPLEMTGTAIIIIICIVFRNMSVGVRSGMAAMSQIDKSLDEASTTLGASGGRTLIQIILPLLKPALIAALVYSFVRAVTTVSAIIFLVSPQHYLATVYIIDRVTNSDYGTALAYSTVLIVLMAMVIAAIRFMIGVRQVGRRGTQTVAMN